MKKYTGFILMIIFLISTVSVHAQSLIVKGKVTDNDGIEVIGATVTLKGVKGVGTATDLNGQYSIKVNNPAKDVLVFSFIGMEPKEVNVNGKKQIDVKMTVNAVTLNEVVAIGYATVKRKDLTGAVSSISGSEVGKVPVTNVAQAIAGKIAGVKVTQSEGSPDASISIRVRGGMSITQSNEPLYIIDGFVSDNGMNGLEPSDIESIDVLKDASATAIYGSAGANGVILITTKKAKEGKSNITYDMYIGFKKLTKRVDLLSNKDFVKMEYERAILNGDDDIKKFLSIYADPYSSSAGTTQEAMMAAYGQIDGIYGNRPGINWQDQVFEDNNPISQNHKVSISGGTKKSNYNASIARNMDDGIMKNSGLVRTNLRAKLNQIVNDRLTFGLNINYTDETTKGLGSLGESGQFSRMQHILQYRPVIGKYGNDLDLLTFQKDPAIDEDSGNQMQNPLISIDAEDRTKINKYLSYNGEVVFKLSKNLTYRGTAGLRNRTTSEELFYKAESRQAINAGAPWGTINKYDYNTFEYNNTLTYAPKLKKGHSFDAMVGQEDYMLETKYLSLTNTTFPDKNFGLDDISLGTTPGIPSSNHIKYRKISFFGRVNYNYKQRYLATATLRADGSNRFGSNNKWGYFPAASFAWRASEEEFIKKLDVFSNLKVRLGYGMAGNDGIGNYRSLSKMSSETTPFGTGVYTSYGSSQLPNPNVKWETNVTSNLGIDMGFFNQRIQATVDVYNNETRDLLLETRLPLLSGYATTIRNIGKTQNRGIEVSINTVNIRNKNFMWETSFNLARNENKVKALSDADFFTTRSGWVGAAEFNDDDYIIQKGESLGSMYGFKLAGIYTTADFDHYDAATKKYVLKEGVPYNASDYPQPGSWKFVDIDGKDGITANDKTIIGNANPDLIGGMINNFTYKGFDLSFALNFQVGGDVYNANKMYFTKMNNRQRNSLAVSADRFTYIDPVDGKNVFTDINRLGEINEGKTMASINGSSVLKFHSGYIEDASFLRLNNITMGYTIPKQLLQKASINSLRVYASAYNLMTLTGYSGFDPEVNTKPNGGLTPGVDWGAYPRSFSFVFGLNLSF